MVQRSNAHYPALRKVAALPWADRWLLAQIFVLLGVARLALRLVPFRRLAHHLGPLQVETPADAPPDHLAQARRVGLALARVSPYTPWTSNCFPQALLAGVACREQPFVTPRR